MPSTLSAVMDRVEAPTLTPLSLQSVTEKTTAAPSRTKGPAKLQILYVIT